MFQVWKPSFAAVDKQSVTTFFFFGWHGAGGLGQECAHAFFEFRQINLTNQKHYPFV
jgi:hypothetical protein